MAENMENKIEEAVSDPETAGQGFDELLKDREFQSEFDRRISRALETARSKWAQETRQKIEQARREEQQIARLSNDERISQEYAVREAELVKRENLLIERELRAEAVKMLNERGLPPELAGAINYSSEENMKTSMETAELAFRAAVQSGVEQRMRGSAPGAARRQETNEISDADYYRARAMPGRKQN